MFVDTAGTRWLHFCDILYQFRVRSRTCHTLIFDDHYNTFSRFHNSEKVVFLSDCLFAGIQRWRIRREVIRVIYSKGTSLLLSSGSFALDVDA